ERARVAGPGGEDGAHRRGARAPGGQVAVDVVGEGGDGDGLGAVVGHHHRVGEVAPRLGAAERVGRLLHGDDRQHVGDGDRGVVAGGGLVAALVLRGGRHRVGLGGARWPGEGGCERARVGGPGGQDGADGGAARRVGPGGEVAVDVVG